MPDTADGSAVPTNAPDRDSEENLKALTREMFDRQLEFLPGEGIYLGLHDNDHRLEELTPDSVESFCRDFDGILSRAERLDTSKLSAESVVDHRMLVSKIRSIHTGFRSFETWKRDPVYLAEMLSGPLTCILFYDYAPKEERLRTVISKARAIPRFLDSIRENLQPVAPITVKYGVDGMKGALSILSKDVPAYFRDVGDEALQREHADVTEKAVSALESYVAWLENDAPKAGQKDYALGEDKYTEWLRHEEMIDTPLGDLESWALESIEEARAGIVECAQRIDASAGVADVVKNVTGDHPATGKVVSTLNTMAEDVYKWVKERDLVTFPNDERVLIADTPEFLRWSFGSMWTPGPFEKPGVKAVFCATDADPSWPAEKQEEHLTAFCWRGLENLTIHEAYPGHFIQCLHQNRVSSLLRKSFWWGVFGEGWAHYCEQMAVDEGFGDGAPDARLVQLQEALNRLCRFVNGIRLHTQPDWTTENGTRFFMDRAWMAEAVARAESERGTFDAFYLRYTLGKKRILDLREECRGALGSRFTLKAFHDALLGAGTGPMPALEDLTRLRLAI